LHRQLEPLEVSVNRYRAVPLVVVALLALAGPSARAQSTWTSAVPTGLDFPWHAPGYVPDELLIKFRQTTPASRIRDLVAAAGATLRRDPGADGLAWVRLAPGTDVASAAPQWEKLPEVEYASANVYARAFFMPNDTVITTTDTGWNLRNVGAYGAWDVVHGDPRIVLAIIDTGVAYEEHDIPDYEQPFVKPGVTHYRQSPDLPGPFLPGWDFVHDDAHANDDNGHGTQAATIAAGMANNVAGSAGIAWGITLMPIKVLDFRGDGTLANIVLGIRYAADHGAMIANLSLGFPPLQEFRALGFPENLIQHTFYPLRDAVAYAQMRGVIVVAAAGNFASADVSPPASYAGVISVGATGFDNTRASYSSFGNGLEFMAPGGDFTDLNHDGVQDLIANMGIKPYRSDGSLANPDSMNVFYFGGTSAAAPHVSGAVALLMSLGMQGQGAIEQTLRATAISPFGNPNSYAREYGFGLIQVDQAVLHPVPEHGIAAARGFGAGAGARIASENPARGAASLAFSVERPGPVSVRVFDVHGALVRTLLSAESPAGSRVLRWDGRDESGSPAPSGLYFFRVETAGGTETRKVALLR
jgi:serine protease